MTAPDDRDADPFTEALKQPDPDRFATPAELARMRADLRANATPEERAALEAIEGEEAKASPAPQALLRDPFLSLYRSHTQVAAICFSAMKTLCEMSRHRFCTHP